MLVDRIKVDKTLQNRLFEKCLFANGVGKCNFSASISSVRPSQHCLSPRWLGSAVYLPEAPMLPAMSHHELRNQKIYWFQPSVFDSWGAILKTNIDSPHSASRIFWLVDSWTCTSRRLCHYKLITYMIYTYMVIWLYILHHNVLQTACSNRMDQF